MLGGEATTLSSALAAAEEQRLIARKKPDGCVEFSQKCVRGTSKQTYTYAPSMTKVATGFSISKGSEADTYA